MPVELLTPDHPKWHEALAARYHAPAFVVMLSDNSLAFYDRSFEPLFTVSPFMGVCDIPRQPLRPLPSAKAVVRGPILREPTPIFDIDLGDL